MLTSRAAPIGAWCALLARNLAAIVAALDSHTLVELDRLAVKPVA